MGNSFCLRIFLDRILEGDILLLQDKIFIENYAKRTVFSANSNIIFKNNIFSNFS